MTVARFTEAWVRSLPRGSDQFTDATLPGFMLVSGAQRATWYAQALVRGGRQTKVRVGHWPEVPQVEARRMAAEALAGMRRGEDPREAERAKRARSTTLDQALELHPDLPPNPVDNVDFNGARRRQVDLAPERLQAWGRAALALKPVRRDLQLFTILTGMRRTAACEARVEHLDLERGCLRVPSPKGGESRAFELPLSPPLVDLLRERAGARTTGWLFPSIRNGGHIHDVRDDGLGDLVGHALRHAYASIAMEAGVPWAELKFLLNHSVAGMGVTGGYLHLGLAHLREMQARASAAILDRIGIEHRAGSWPPAARPDGRHNASDQADIEAAA